MSDSPAGYTHLHVHSNHSLLGATADIDRLVAAAAEQGFSHLALTDHNALYGALPFAAACRRAEIQPLLGLCLSVVFPHTLTPPPVVHPPGRLLLLAKNLAGYRNLCRLSSLLQGNAARLHLLDEGLSWEQLRAHTDGLLCLEGGQEGWLYRLLARGDNDQAGRYCSLLAGIFEEDAFIGLELHAAADVPLWREGIRLGSRFGLRPVAAQPVYGLEPAALELLPLLAAIDHICPVNAVPPEALPPYFYAGGTHHWLTPEETAAHFASFPEAVAEVGRLVARCEPAVPDGRPVWPAPHWLGETPPEEALRQRSRNGRRELFGADPPPAVVERLERELDALIERGFAAFFLVVADLMRYAREEDIPVGTRGSVANSLVAYCLQITTVNPIAHGLLFERFLNPARQTLPDIDLDICSRRRDDLLDFVRRRYGAEHVALVGTINTFRLRSALREVAKAYGLGDEGLKRLIKLTPSRWHPDPGRRVRPELEKVLAIETDPLAREVATKAFQLIGFPHHLGVHAGGVVITPEPLTHYLPVQWTVKDFLVTQYDHNVLEEIGIPKIDMLGLRALTVLTDTAALVRQHHDPAFRLQHIADGDASTGDLLTAAETIGVFQCESTGAQRTLTKLKARSVRDLAVANAFFKPGPATGGMAGNFVRRYRGEEAIGYLHPSLEPILAPTQGVLLFQEQILRVIREIAGLSWGEADVVRKGMSKFQPEQMLRLQARFLAGCQRPEPDGPAFSREQAETLWEQVVAFSGYGFNQGHATAYADLSYRSAYLKAHWPFAFLCARLINGGGFYHQAVYIAEAQRLGARVFPPHVNTSQRRFTLRFEAGDAQLWMGLGQIRELRRRTVAAILSAREERPFTSLTDLMGRVHFQRKELRHLIMCGGLDGLGTNRATLLAEARLLQDVGFSGSQLLLFPPEVPPQAAETAAERLRWELELLGQPLSVHPLELLPPAEGIHPLVDVGSQLGGRVTLRGALLPGWGYRNIAWLGDGRTLLMLEGDERLMKRLHKAWEVVEVNGRWRSDAWGSGWFQVEKVSKLALARRK